MWNSDDPHRSVILPPSKGFLTPSLASNNSKASFSPMSETKKTSPVNKHNLFHVIHKVPAGDSPYVRAKHVQLIEKDPSRAISLFWSAINSGDRVDSALKDMAIVMKQLDRSDEAIEAIKSFRHLCPVDSQESLDNVLVELYKRAGRIEEEIEMLRRKLKRIEEGAAFGGRRTKAARSQGKKVHITVDEEKARVLGNLAWACLQQNNYKAAEEYYRKALVLEPDKNKQCNLAICLMNLNRLPEAKSLLRAVKLACGTNLVDESFAKSFERACELLTELDPKWTVELSVKDSERRNNAPTSLPSPNAFPRSGEGGNRREETDCVSTQNREFYCGNHFENKANLRDNISALQRMSLKSGYLENNSGERRSDLAKRSRACPSGTEQDLATSWRRNTAPQSSSWRKPYFSPAPFTQPRRCLWRHNDNDEDHRKKSFSSDHDWRKKSPTEECHLSQVTLTEEKLLPSTTETPNTTVDSSSICDNKKKSWADMAEEEENEEDLYDEIARGFFYESPCLQTQMKNGDRTFDEEFNDENTNSNTAYGSADLQTQMRNVTRKLEQCGLRDEYISPGLSDSLSKSQSVRRSLFFDQEKGKNIRLLRRNNRLKVFQDITQESMN